jgi:hypothetical protein
MVQVPLASLTVSFKKFFCWSNLATKMAKKVAPKKKNLAKVKT